MLKNLLIGSTILVILGGAMAFVLGPQLFDDARVNRVAASIAHFDLPAGYEPDYAVNILDYTIAAYKSNEGDGHLVWLQAPTGIMPSEQVMQGYVANNDQETMAWESSTLVSHEQRIVRGQPANLTISDRINGNGEPYRSLNMVFEGENGTVLLVVNQPLALWDAAMIDAFIASIR
ncbi:MAG: hypothetical protein CL607_24380 [Anaerolineaceae bacterium]|nr:hypothetical protein [Anaerolineaceae bacterium]